MNRSVLSSLLFACLASTLALAHAAPVHAAADADRPLVSIDLPTDPNAPVIATLVMAGHSYRMIVDTGAGDLVFHLPVAQRNLQSAAADPGQPRQAKGLYGDIELKHFRADTFAVGDWTVQTRGEVLAVDLGRLVQEYGVDGLLGTPYLSELSWHWDRRAHTLSGFRQGAPAIARIRARLQCVTLLDVDGNPGVPLSIGGEQAAFAIDTGDMGVSGNLNPQDREALAYRGAVRASAHIDGHLDVSGKSLPPLQMTQIQNVSMGSIKLDGLVFGEINRSSRLGLGFLGKFDEVLLDFGTGKFCTPAVDHLDPDTLSPWRSN